MGSYYLGLNLLDYGFRNYNLSFGRFIRVDPLAEKYLGWSPYNSVLNNPVRLIDPTGMSPEDNDWIPETDNNGNITLKAEKGDNLQTLQKYLQGSDLSQEKIKQVYNNRSKDGTVTLPSDNYSEAYNYSKTNSQEFTNRISDNSVENYNCYHFAVNGVWENDIYSFFGSSGAYNMEPEAFQQVLNDFFIPVTADKAIYGETIIAMNFSGGVPQHSAVYAGTSSTGEIYIMQKPGLSMAPNIIPLKDAGSGMHDDFKFYNEKGSIKK